VPATVIDGRKLAAELRSKVARDVAAFSASTGLPPRLDVVMVGDNPASQAYVGTKARMAGEVGITSRVHALPAGITQGELLGFLGKLDADEEVDGILVQLPLPAHIDADAIPEALSPSKDVDGFHPLNLGRLAGGCWPEGAPALVPCTPQGCMMLLRSALPGEGLRGRKALVLGRSTIVGRPMALLLLAADCTVTIAHSRTRDLREACEACEIVVAAVGRPGLVQAPWLRPDSIVIDVGINRVTDPDGKSRLVGDVAYAEAVERVRAITPVPGGVGPMTVACLLLNTLRAAQARRAPRGHKADV
jgi:methylenetetrahydrofolate dehydrogenase (NADP+) / methenyltetrahydrofolate cyclohydrolase